MLDRAILRKVGVYNKEHKNQPKKEAIRKKVTETMKYIFFLSNGGNNKLFAVENILYKVNNRVYTNLNSRKIYRSTNHTFERSCILFLIM